MELLKPSCWSGSAATARIRTVVDSKLPNDLPRNSENFALIGDPRNDENLLVAQTHLAFLKAHNKVIDKVEPDFDKARRLVTWHYQWIVLHDFLGRLIDPAALDAVRDDGRKFYVFDPDAFIPVEFSVAAYRFGHSMVRHEYDHNQVFGPGAGDWHKRILPPCSGSAASRATARHAAAEQLGHRLASVP
jgi:hypothetical protein